MCHHVWLIFVFLVEMGFRPFGQVGLELLTSSNPPALASQSAEITGVSHHTQSTLPIIKHKYLPGTVLMTFACFLSLSLTSACPAETTVHMYKDKETASERPS